MGNREQQPKTEIENTRDRFMDFIGNALNGILGYFGTLHEAGISEESKELMLAGLKNSWQSFFERIEAFINHDFVPEGKITKENLEAFLQYRNRNPLERESIEDVNNLYHSIISDRDV